MSTDYGKVAVLMGGWSVEREVSLVSGEAVLNALLKKGVDAHRVDVNRDICQVLQRGKFTRAFNILHGRSGEDGEIQGLLEILQIPYTGSGITASAVAMDKLVTKIIWAEAGLLTPAYKEISGELDLTTCIENPGYPLVIKPATEGSSVGVHKVESQADIEAAWVDATQYGKVMAEQYIHGDEYTVAILGDQALPIIKIETPHVFYDYEAKYQTDSTLYHIPCGLGKTDEETMQKEALKAFRALGCHGWGRVDFMRDEAGEDWLIEANTQPGMTSHSLVPKAAEAAGLAFEDLVLRILDTSL